MYIHLGNGTVVNSSNIISIMDLDTSSVAKNTREFLKTAEEEGFIKNVSEEIPRTFIVCEENGQSVIYLTNISSKALAGRIKKTGME